jgi:hypothetical protein
MARYITSSPITISAVDRPYSTDVDEYVWSVEPNHPILSVHAANHAITDAERRVPTSRAGYRIVQKTGLLI